MSASREDAPFEAFKRQPTPATLTDLLKYHRDYVYNICFQILRHPEDAEDVAQEVLLEVIRVVSKFESPRPFKVWLYRAALHRSLNHKKARTRRVEVAKKLAGSSLPEGVTMESEERAGLMEAIGSLDDPTRCLLLEHYFDKLTLEEIGQREGISSMAVWKRLERAREQIRRALLGAGFAVTGAGIAQGLESLTPVVAPLSLIGSAAVAEAALGVKAAIVTAGGAAVGTSGAVVGAGIVALVIWMGSMARQDVTLTSTADFLRGNNEGLISTEGDRIARDRITTGTVGAWSLITALPSVRMNHSSVAHDGFLYVVGGSLGSFNFDDRLSDVRVAPINANGSLGTWTTTSALPSGRRDHSSCVYNGFLYTIGGNAYASNLLSDVLVAPINANGSLGAWTTTTALPSMRVNHSSVVYNGFVYVIGGNDGSSGVNAVLVAPLNADGTIGAWSTTTALPSNSYGHSSVAYNGFLYSIGGYSDGAGNLSRVLAAPLNADGTVGAWSTTTALPSGIYGHTSDSHSGFLYVIGGFDPNFNPLNDVLVASINADGTVGTWTASTELPGERHEHSSCVYNGSVYILGGKGIADAGVVATDEVLITPINPDAGNASQTGNRLRGAYSHLVDLETDMSTRYILLNGQISPGGRIRLQGRVAPDATGVFGNETIIDPAPLGSHLAIAGTGRYVWIRLTLDDTSTTDVSQPTFISDITTSQFAPPSTGVVLDGAGADIDTQASTTTIEANWTGFTPVQGDNVAFYEWAIGTAPDQTNVQDWVNVGVSMSASNSSLSLSSGMKFVSVRATTAAGFTSPVATSDGVQVILPPSPPGGGDEEKKGRCGFGTSAASGSIAALLGGIALMGAILRRRRGRQ